MPKNAFLGGRKHKMSLTAEVSLLLTLVAIIPLLMTITISQLLSRPQLVSQSVNAMAQDTHTRIRLIDAYLRERINEVQILSRNYELQEYVQGKAEFKQRALRALSIISQNDINYDSWAVLDLQGNSTLGYPAPPVPHGEHLIPPNMLGKIQHSTEPILSGVFYNPKIEKVSMIIYMPITGASYSQVVGILRAEVLLNYIWNVVDSQADNVGSYAFILDQRGVRIAYTSPTLTRSSFLFKAIAPLSPADEQKIATENLYGHDQKPVTVVSEPGLAQNQKNHASSRFEMVPVGQEETYEVVKAHIPIVGWTYFALRPLKVIVSIADQQLYTTLFIAATVLVLAIVIGMFTGRRITQPILLSIEQQQQAYEREQYLNQLKDQILVTVGHELRTPLTEVYGYLELLRTYHKQLDEETEVTFLKRATSGCEELQLLISNMLEAVRTDDQPAFNDIQSVRLDTVVHDVLDLFHPRILQNYALRIEVPETLMVRADQQYLRQILRNLFSNAFKYTPPRTQITIDTTYVDIPRDEVNTIPGVCICVKDSGPGIASEDIPTLFDKFVRLKRDQSSAIRGVGLGLYISRQLVETMGGTIWVESEGIEGRGSRFCFTLPLAKEADQVSLQPDSQMQRR